MTEILVYVVEPVLSLVYKVLLRITWIDEDRDQSMGLMMIQMLACAISSCILFGILAIIPLSGHRCYRVISSRGVRKAENHSENNEEANSAGENERERLWNECKGSVSSDRVIDQDTRHNPKDRR